MLYFCCNQHDFLSPFSSELNIIITLDLIQVNSSNAIRDLCSLCHGPPSVEIIYMCKEKHCTITSVLFNQLVKEDNVKSDSKCEPFTSKPVLQLH